MFWPHDEAANLSWAIHGPVAHTRTEALVDELLLLASKTKDDGIAQVYYTATDIQDFVLVGTDDVDPDLDVVSLITEFCRQERVAWHPLSKQVLALRIKPTDWELVMASLQRDGVHLTNTVISGTMCISLLAKRATHVMVMFTDPGRQDTIHLQLGPRTTSDTMQMQEIYVAPWSLLQGFRSQMPKSKRSD